MTTHRKYTYEEVKEIAEKYSTLTEFTKNHVGAYEAALHNCWLSSFTNLKRKRIHTVESVLNECNKFNNYKEFIKLGCGSAYNVARKNKWLDDYTWFQKRESKFTYEICKKLASQYKSRMEFQKACSGAYSQAVRKGWLDDFFTEK